MAFVSALLTVPYFAMKFTTEVNWTALDFVAAAVMLFSAGLAIEFALRMVTSFWTRIAVCGAILLTLFVVWAELAVGIIGTPFAGS